MIIIVNFILSALGMMLFAKNDRQHFGTLMRAMMTIWQIETLDNVRVVPAPHNLSSLPNASARRSGRRSCMSMYSDAWRMATT